MKSFSQIKDRLSIVFQTKNVILVLKINAWYYGRNRLHMKFAHFLNVEIPSFQPSVRISGITYFLSTLFPESCIIQA